MWVVLVAAAVGQNSCPLVSTCNPSGCTKTSCPPCTLDYFSPSLLDALPNQEGQVWVLDATSLMADDVKSILVDASNPDFAGYDEEFLRGALTALSGVYTSDFSASASELTKLAGFPGIAAKMVTCTDLFMLPGTSRKRRSHPKGVHSAPKEKRWTMQLVDPPAPPATRDFGSPISKLLVASGDACDDQSVYPSSITASTGEVHTEDWVTSYYASQDDSGAVQRQLGFLRMSAYTINVKALRNLCERSASPTPAPTPPPTSPPTEVALADCGEAITFDDVGDTLYLTGKTDDENAVDLSASTLDCQNRINDYHPCVVDNSHGFCTSSEPSYEFQDTNAWWRYTLTVCGLANNNNGPQTVYWIANIDPQHNKLYRKQHPTSLSRSYLHDSSTAAGISADVTGVNHDRYAFVVPASSGDCAVATPGPTPAPSVPPTPYPSPFPSKRFIAPACEGAILYTGLDGTDALRTSIEGHFGVSSASTIVKNYDCQSGVLGYTRKFYYHIEDSLTVVKSFAEVRSYDIDFEDNEQRIRDCIEALFTKAGTQTQVAIQPQQYVVAAVEANTNGKLVGALMVVDDQDVSTRVEQVVDDLTTQMDKNSVGLDVASAFMGLRNGASFDMQRGDNCIAEMPGQLGATANHAILASSTLNVAAKDAIKADDGVAKLMQKAINAMNSVSGTFDWGKCSETSGDTPNIGIVVSDDRVSISFKPCGDSPDSNVVVTPTVMRNIATELGCFELAGISFNAVKIVDYLLTNFENLPRDFKSPGYSASFGVGNVLNYGTDAAGDETYHLVAPILWIVPGMDEFSALRGLAVAGAYECIVDDIDTKGREMKRSDACIAQAAARLNEVGGAIPIGKEVQAHSCYYHPVDTDQDGVNDLYDPCPNNKFVGDTQWDEVSGKCDSPCTVTHEDPTADDDVDGTINCQDPCPDQKHAPNVQFPERVDTSMLKHPLCIVEMEKGCPDPSMFSDDDGDNYVVCEDLCPNNADVHSFPIGCPCWYKGDETKDTDGDGTYDCLDKCVDDASRNTVNRCGECAPDPPVGTPCEASGSGSGSGSLELDCTEPHHGNTSYHCKCDEDADCTSQDRCDDISGEQTKNMLDAKQEEVLNKVPEELKSRVQERIEGTLVCTCFDVTTEDAQGVPTCIKDDKCTTVVGAFFDACNNACVNDPNVSAVKTNCPTVVPSCSNIPANPQCTKTCANGARPLRRPYQDHLDTSGDSCPCTWSSDMITRDTDQDGVVDCWDVCGSKVDEYNRTDDSPPINVAGGYSDRDKDPSNVADDDNDGFRNCIDFCPRGKNSDPRNATSPCVERVEPTGSAIMPGPDGSSSTTTKMLGAAVPVVAVLGVF